MNLSDNDNDERQQNHEVRVIRPEGRLDVAVAPTFREQLKVLLNAGSTKLIIDLSEVSFVDSSGLGSIIVGVKLARQAGGDIRIVQPPNQFNSLLQLTSVNRVLPVYASVEEALVDFD